MQGWKVLKFEISSAGILILLSSATGCLNYPQRTQNQLLKTKVQNIYEDWMNWLRRWTLILDSESESDDIDNKLTRVDWGEGRLNVKKLTQKMGNLFQVALLWMIIMCALLTVCISWHFSHTVIQSTLQHIWFICCVMYCCKRNLRHTKKV